MNIVLELNDVTADEGRVRSYLAHTLREALGPHARRFARAEVQLVRRERSMACAIRLHAARADLVVRVDASARRLHVAVERAAARAWDVLHAVGRAGAVAA